MLLLQKAKAVQKGACLILQVIAGRRDKFPSRCARSRRSKSPGGARGFRIKIGHARGIVRWTRRAPAPRPDHFESPPISHPAHFQDNAAPHFCRAAA